MQFGGCSASDLPEVYRAFTALCMDRHANRALLKAGDDYAPGHEALSGALQTMARHAALPPDFKLALMPSTAAVEAVYREAQQRWRRAGLNAWVFLSEEDALDWLEGRAIGGPTVS